MAGERHAMCVNRPLLCPQQAVSGLYPERVPVFTHCFRKLHLTINLVVTSRFPHQVSRPFCIHISSIPCAVHALGLWCSLIWSA